VESLNQAMPEPELLLSLPEGFEIWRIHPMLLKEQDKNAQVQPPKMFKALVRNIKVRKALESLPLCAHVENAFWIISGHHRVRAAIQADAGQGHSEASCAQRHIGLVRPGGPAPASGRD
jgi:hypothetical protein